MCNMPSPHDVGGARLGSAGVPTLTVIAAVNKIAATPNNQEASLVTVVRTNQIIGRGWAGFVTVFLLFSFMAMRNLMDTLEYTGYYYGHKGLPIAMGVFGVLFTVVVGIYLNRKRIVFDPQSKRTVTVGNRHTVLLIPIQYWSIVIVFMTIVDLSHPGR